MVDQCFQFEFQKDNEANNPAIREIYADYLVRHGDISEAKKYYMQAKSIYHRNP